MKENAWKSNRVSDQKRQNNDVVEAMKEAFADDLETWEAMKDTYVREEILPEDDEVSAWDKWCATLFDTLRHKDFSFPSHVFLHPVPQNDCCFYFGAQKLPLPAVALMQLWTKDPLAMGICPLCKGEVVATSFGGLLNVGGYKGRCLVCAVPLFRQIGGLADVQGHLRSFFEGTGWPISGADFGGFIASEGKELAKALGLSEPPEMPKTLRSYLRAGQNNLVIRDVVIEDEKQ